LTQPFRLVLTLARDTGRRINSICKLSVRDLLVSRDQMLMSALRIAIDRKRRELAG
jgi:hypothetical protein